MTAGLREEALRDQIVGTSHQLHQRGWVANHDGNLSARLGGGRFLCTPTAVSKGDVRPEWLIVVDGEGKVVQGTRRVFGEIQMHLAAYQARPDIGVVLHAHPPTATGFGVAGVPLEHPFMAEPVVSLGPVVPVVPYHRPGDPALGTAIAGALGRADVLLLDRHGVLAVGGGFEQAFLRLELVEHLARIALVARQLGGVRPLPPEEVAALSARGRPASEPPVSTDATPTGAVHERPPAVADGPRPDVRQLVDQALQRFR